MITKNPITILALKPSPTFPGSLFLRAIVVRLAEDALAGKVRYLQRGKLTDADCRRFQTIHHWALDTIERLRTTRLAMPSATADRLGVAEGAAELASFDPKWQGNAAEEMAKIAKTLGPACSAVHHIGSTSVAGLAAKPIIDMALEVDATALATDFTAIRSAMNAAGYAYLGYWGRRGGHYFARTTKGVGRTHSAQIHPTGAPEIKRLLHFQERLRADPAFRSDYFESKAALAHAFSRQRGMYFWFKAHWIDGNLLDFQGSQDWAHWFVSARHPTMLTMFRRSILLGLGLGKTHPMAE